MWWVAAFAEVPDRGRGRRRWWIAAFAGRTVGEPAFAGDDGLEYVVEVPDRGVGDDGCVVGFRLLPKRRGASPANGRGDI